MPRYRQRLALRAARPGPAGLDRRPALQPLLPHPPHRAAEAGRRRRRSSASPGGCSRSASTAPSRCGRSGWCSAWPATASRSIAKTHHALVDGISGVDITTVLFDTAREPDADGAAVAVERQAAAGPGEAARRGAARARDGARRDGPRRTRAAARRRGKALAQVKDGLHEHRRDDARRHQRPRAAEPVQRRDRAAPALHVPRRRPRSLQGDQGLARRARSTTSCSTSVALALGRYLREHGHDTDGLVLKAMVPVSVRPKSQRGALGNQVAAMWAPLPVGVENPADCLQRISRGDGGPEELGTGRRRAGAHQPRRLRAADDPQPGRAPAGRASRSSTSSSRTSPARSSRSTCSAGGCEVLYPVVPLAQRQALGIAVMSYDGHLGFGLLGDYDALPDLEQIADDLKWAIASLGRAAGVSTKRPARNRRTASSRAKSSANGARSNPAAAPTASRTRSAAAPPASPPPPAEVRLALCQLNAAVGDIAGNAARIPEQARAARDAGAAARPVPRARADRLPARGPAAQGALPRRRGAALARARARDRGDRRGRRLPRARRGRLQRGRRARRRRGARGLPQGLPAQLRRVRRAALLPGRRRRPR